MKIACLADMHGNLPEKLPKADMLVIAGDICPATEHGLEFQLDWLENEFTTWLFCTCSPKYDQEVYITPGNHDWMFEIKPLICADILDATGCQLLLGDTVELTKREVILHGYPWTPRFCDWAFNSDNSALKRHAAAIPQDTDILVTHGPPLQILDIPGGEMEHCGCKHLRTRLRSVRPKLHIFGHIHGSYGQTVIDETTFVNASYVDEGYNPRGPESIQVIEI